VSRAISASTRVFDALWQHEVVRCRPGTAVHYIVDNTELVARDPGSPLRGVRDDRCRGHLIACGLIGEPVPPVMISGGPQKKNS
jgi:hypothetical protein